MTQPSLSPLKIYICPQDEASNEKLFTLLSQTCDAGEDRIDLHITYQEKEYRCIEIDKSYLPRIKAAFLNGTLLCDIFGFTNGGVRPYIFAKQRTKATLPPMHRARDIHPNS